uniref:Uncharacterized protein n=1 Tax=Anguilla anguilla TaxID=7936 RepID=A0A0E9S6A5_ANGAN
MCVCVRGCMLGLIILILYAISQYLLESYFQGKLFSWVH